MRVCQDCGRLIVMNLRHVDGDLRHMALGLGSARAPAVKPLDRMTRLVMF